MYLYIHARMHTNNTRGTHTYCYTYAHTTVSHHFKLVMSHGRMAMDMLRSIYIEHLSQGRHSSLLPCFPASPLLLFCNHSSHAPFQNYTDIYHGGASENISRLCAMLCEETTWLIACKPERLRVEPTVIPRDPSGTVSTRWNSTLSTASKSTLYC